MLPTFVNKINNPVYPFRYSVCTMVTRTDEYTEMLNSFIRAGFTTDVCEYLIIDNSVANVMDAYEGINSLLQKAQGEYIIICHQDILLLDTSTLQILEQRIAETSVLDANWAVLGNAGAAARLYNRYAFKILYPNAPVDTRGTLPQQVCSVDENFILVKNKANLALSGDVSGYHLYGLDICTIATLMGYTCYVIDFLLLHKSRGNVDSSFNNIKRKLQLKYTNFMQGRYLNTTITGFYISGSKFRNRLFNTRLFRRVIKTAQQLTAVLTKGNKKY